MKDLAVVSINLILSGVITSLVLHGILTQTLRAEDQLGHGIFLTTRLIGSAMLLHNLPKFLHRGCSDTEVQPGDMSTSGHRRIFSKLEHVDCFSVCPDLPEAARRNQPHPAPNDPVFINNVLRARIS